MILAQTARLDACGEYPRVHLSHPRCSGPNGIESLQSQRRICRPEPSMVTPHTREVLHRASVTLAVLAKRGQPRRVGLFSTLANTGGHTVLCQAQHTQCTRLC